MQNLNSQMISNVLTSALTSTVTAWLTCLAAWSHFSSSDNTALAAFIAAGLSIAICQIGTIFVNRWGFLVNTVATDGVRVVLPTQAAADAMPNSNVVGPADVKVVKP